MNKSQWNAIKAGKINKYLATGEQIITMALQLSESEVTA